MLPCARRANMLLNSWRSVCVDAIWSVLLTGTMVIMVSVACGNFSRSEERALTQGHEIHSDTSDSGSHGADIDGQSYDPQWDSVVNSTGPTRTRVQWDRRGQWIVFTYGLGVFKVRSDGTELALVAETAPLTTEDFRGIEPAFGSSFDLAPRTVRIAVPAVYEDRSVAPNLLDGFEIVVLSWTDTSAPVEAVGKSDGYFDFFPRWSPDESMLAFVRHTSEGSRLVVSRVGDGKESDVASSPRVLRVDVASSPPVLRVHSIRQIPAWSPDGTTIAFVGSNQEDSPAWPHADWAIFTVTSDGTDLRRLTGTLSPPAWSPSGARIAFAKADGGEVWLFTMAADGSDLRRVTVIDGWHRSARAWRGYDASQPAQAWIKLVEWSPDGSMILFTCGTAVCVVTPDAKQVGRSPTRLPWPLAARDQRWVVLSRAEVAAAWSPDSSRIAVGLQQEPTMNLHHDIMLYTMSPDGEDVQVLVRGGRRDAEARFEAPLRAAGPVPRLIPTNAYGCSTGHAVPDPANNPDLVRDCDTLLKLRDVLAGAAELNWRGDRPMTDWDGVVVAGSPPRVEELNLSRRGLTGTIPTRVSALSKLQRLDLHVNRLSGKIPGELVLLQDLTYLDLGFNQIDGEIPKWIGRLSKLRVLDLAFNSFWGPIPETLAQLSDLRQLDLRSNQLSGQVPADLKLLVKLENLTLDGNLLIGCVPAGLPINQEVLGLSACELAG